jgi:hypothetical protein
MDWLSEACEAWLGSEPRVVGGVGLMMDEAVAGSDGDDGKGFSECSGTGIAGMYIV